MVRKRAVVASAIALLACVQAAAAQERYVRAEENQNHELVITTTTGDRIVLGKSHRKWPGDDGEQVAFRDIAISQDRSAVGWVSLFANCCTSYPIPILVEAYSAGERRTFDPAIAPWHWCFVDGSARIAAVSTTVHGSQNEVLEMWDVSTRMKLDEVFWREDQEEPKSPPWVVALRADRWGRQTHLCSTK